MLVALRRIEAKGNHETAVRLRATVAAVTDAKDRGALLRAIDPSTLSRIDPRREEAHAALATPDDVDRAVESGLGYPKGAPKLGDAFGPRRVLAVLEGLRTVYGDLRHRPSPWLARRARLCVSLSTDEPK